MCFFGRNNREFPAKLGCNHENLEMNHPRSGFEGLKMWWTLFKNLFKDNFKTKFGSYCELSQNGWSSPPKWEHKIFWAEDDFESWDPGALWGLGGGGFPDCGKCIACLGFPKNPLIVPPWKLADWERSPIFAPHLMGDAAPWQSTGEEQVNRFIFRHSLWVR